MRKERKLRGRVRHEDYLLPTYYQFADHSNMKLGTFNLFVFILMMVSIDVAGSFVVSFDVGILLFGLLYSRQFLKAGNLGTITAYHRREHNPIAKTIRRMQFLRAGASSRLLIEAVVLVLMAVSLGTERVLDLIGTEIIHLFMNPLGYLVAVLVSGHFIYRMHYQDKLITLREFFENVRYVMRRHDMNAVHAREYAYANWQHIQNERRGVNPTVPVPDAQTGQIHEQAQDQSLGSAGIEGMRNDRSESEKVDLEPRRRKART